MGGACFSLILITCFFSFSSVIHSKCLSDQRLHLLQFRDALDFTFSNKMANWNQSTGCCKWGGVGCDGYGNVISLQLEEESLSVRNNGWKTVFNLEHLQELNLAWNTFSVRIPMELYNLTKLNYLNLSTSGFKGQIPMELSKLNSLITLDLSADDYDSQLLQSLQINPEDTAAVFQNLTELRELYLDEVNISSQGNVWCNAFSSLSKLQVLSLGDCSLSGPISPSFSNLTSLTAIQLGGNGLSTAVPDFFANFTNLTVLSLSSCDLHGQFPEKILQLPTLESLDLSDNQLLGGTLPRFLRNGSLKEIILSRTNFSGSLPNSLRYLEALSQLDLSSCNFSGPISSTSFTNLSELVHLDLTQNEFSGSIPSFKMSEKLAWIYLSYNAFIGPISSTHFEGLINLEYLDLAYNSLSGSVPSSLFALPSLQTLLLHNNYFDGHNEEFPNASSTLLEELDLHNNNIGGFIPKFFFNLSTLTHLDLSYNSFTGTLRLGMFNGLQNLDRLDLSHNNLSIDASLFSLPQLTLLYLVSCNLKMFPDLQNQTLMMILDLSLNSITGEIPNWIWTIGLSTLNLSFNLLEHIQMPHTFPNSLHVLDIHANLLNGEIFIPTHGVAYLDYSNNTFNSIPSNIGDYVNDTNFFYLSNNRITGDIPESMCKATSLLGLDLSNNFLRGRIPTCLFEMVESLAVLNLGGNKLDGPIPNTFPSNCKLHMLDLSNNTLQGRIPISLSHCKSLQILNVGNNLLKDNFPCTLTHEADLRVLILRFNRFHGEMNCSWDEHNWPSLQIFDIAYNDFSGALPPIFFLNCKEMMIDDSTEAPPLQYIFDSYVPWNDAKFQDSVKVIIKSMELELVQILASFKTMDLSNNKFRGKIPDAIGGLRALYGLNLSHNALTGAIPGSFGKLVKLESLDLSMNQLTGMIPSELADLIFLSFLNLSDNQLIGKIPQGRQLQTFTEDSFLGNKGLCGFPLNISCDNSNNNGTSSPGSPSDIHSAKKEIDWLYVSVALGFSVGLGIISLLNYLSPTWWRQFNALILLFLLRSVLRVQVQQKSYRNPIPRL